MSEFPRIPLQIEHCLELAAFQRSQLWLKVQGTTLAAETILRKNHEQGKSLGR